MPPRRSLLTRLALTALAVGALVVADGALPAMHRGAVPRPPAAAAGAAALSAAPSAATGPQTQGSGAPAALRIEPLGATSSRTLAGVVIVVDPGHDGGNAAHPSAVNRRVDAGNGLRKACNTAGTETDSGYTEHAYTWDVAQRLARVLRAKGARVVLTRSSDTGVGPCIDRRAAIGNAARATLVVSIHGDGNLAPGARGFHVITSSRMAGGPRVVAASAELARVLRGAFANGTGMPRSTYTGGGRAITVRRDIGGLNLSQRPAVMIETGNMRHPADARLMAAGAFRERAALALARGIELYLGR